MPELTAFLWFEDRAEEAANHYTSIFDDGAITRVMKGGPGGPGTPGATLTVEFALAGLRFIALNGGPQYRFNEAVSIMVQVDAQDEVDRYWAALTAEGEPGPCGWLKDRFGLSWQVVPKLLFELRSDPDEAKAQAVTDAMLRMGKIESSVLQAAYDDA
ncbi:VOC family protein [Glycomyces sp. TRM65418]|uniref:VOC family protein n=1 Tax=Glycomyces sp. TRM65418 TaxID=2867006 RepID=UPI001CE4DFFE|nr:VOC family protein [Glycomyces sp. TRM65418]MCC3765887.1 VOC family protein [Glycomyces sp. TRM65418]QZD55470.1 VOC family protein [Glycomyces sp. TRM65418]